MQNRGWLDGLFAAVFVVALLGGMAQPLPVRAATFEAQITTSSDSRAGEPEVAINPKNPNNIAYFIMTRNYTYNRKVQNLWTEKGYLNCYLAISFDRGKTWKSVPNPFSVSRITLCGDPMIAFGPDGTLYAAADGMGIDMSRPEGANLSGEVVFARSSGRGYDMEQSGHHRHADRSSLDERGPI